MTTEYHIYKNMAILRLEAAKNSFLLLNYALWALFLHLLKALFWTFAYIGARLYFRK